MNKEIADEAARYFSDESDSDDSDNVTKSMKKQKSLLLSETYELNKNRRCCSSCKVVTNYLMIEQQKKQRALKIGIFTVFLVVCMITMLKSVVDSSPIIFVKIGQEQAGAIDYQLTSPTWGNQYTVGDVNQYAINPFCNPFNYSMQPYDDTTCEPEDFQRLGLRDDPPEKPSVYNSFTPEGDHVLYYT